MTRLFGRNKRITSLVLGSIAASLLFPVTALAGSGRYTRDGDHHRHRVDSRHRHASQYAYRGHGHRHRAHPGYHRVPARYYCEPCNHGFHTRGDFHAHLVGHHHVSPLLLPFLIVQHAFGWIFYG